MKRQNINKVDMFMELTGKTDEHIIELICLGLSRFIHYQKAERDNIHIIEAYNDLQIANGLLNPEYRPELPELEDL